MEEHFADDREAHEPLPVRPSPETLLQVQLKHRDIGLTADTYLGAASACRPLPRADVRASAPGARGFQKDIIEQAAAGKNPRQSAPEQEK